MVSVIFKHGDVPPVEGWRKSYHAAARHQAFFALEAATLTSLFLSSQAKVNFCMVTFLCWATSPAAIFPLAFLTHSRAEMRAGIGGRLGQWSLTHISVKLFHKRRCHGVKQSNAWPVALTFILSFETGFGERILRNVR